MAPLLQTRDLSLHIAQRDLLVKLNWQVQAGECWAVIGKNGAGKSTLLRCLASLREVDAGEVLLQGTNLKLWKLAALAKQRAYLPQARVDAFAYTVLEMVLSARYPYQDTHYWDASEDVQMVIDALALLDVSDFAQRDVRSLSGGERQRVAIAALLVQDAPLMLLDEPANALDLAHQVSVMNLLAKACSQQNKAVVMVSHDLNLSYRIATHALLLMPDGTHLIGEKSAVMNAQDLSLCLGHTIEKFEHGTQTIFLPQAIS
ncbi:MAG: ABC transporter ATP-binding protein [Undibacterium sp.]|nr:ABC transporter ATP-binding protein [Undibacterium sp.]